MMLHLKLLYATSLAGCSRVTVGAEKVNLFNEESVMIYCLRTHNIHILVQGMRSFIAVTMSWPYLLHSKDGSGQTALVHSRSQQWGCVHAV